MKDNIFVLNTFEEHIKNSTTNEKDQQTNNNYSSSNSLITDESSELKLCETPFIYKKEKYLVDSKQNKIK